MKKTLVNLKRRFEKDPLKVTVQILTIIAIVSGLIAALVSSFLTSFITNELETYLTEHGLYLVTENILQYTVNESAVFWPMAIVIALILVVIMLNLLLMSSFLPLSKPTTSAKSEKLVTKAGVAVWVLVHMLLLSPFAGVIFKLNTSANWVLVSVMLLALVSICFFTVWSKKYDFVWRGFKVEMRKSISSLVLMNWVFALVLYAFLRHNSVAHIETFLLPLYAVFVCLVPGVMNKLEQETFVFTFSFYPILSVVIVSLFYFLTITHDFIFFSQLGGYQAVVTSDRPFIQRDLKRRCQPYNKAYLCYVVFNGRSKIYLSNPAVDGGSRKTDPKPQGSANWKSFNKADLQFEYLPRVERSR